MKRIRDSIPSARASQRGNGTKEKVDEAESQELGTSFADLPSNIIAHILLQLPTIKSILICKCVCKNWKALISEPHFAKLHFERAPVTLMIRTDDHSRVSRTLHLLEWEPEKFEIENNNHVKLEPRFKLPLRDAKSFLEKKDEIKNKTKRDFRAANLVLEKRDEDNNGGRQSPYIACNPNHDKFDIVNSCNGLLCLCDPSNRNPLVICNPVTGEFIRLPEAATTTITPTGIRTAQVRMQGEAGFGFQSKTNEYKVIKMRMRHVLHANEWVFEGVVLEIHTVGTPTWRNVEVDPHILISRLEFPTCVNGALHWIRFNGRQGSILCFNFESERLLEFPSPPHVFENNRIYGKRISMGELREFLYICVSNFFSGVTMWVMNEYGSGESWTRVYNIETLGRPHHDYGFCWPVKPFEEGVAILFKTSCNYFIYYEPEKYGFKAFQIHGTESKFVEVIPHIPSLISLKDVVKGDNIEVLNIHSRCAKFKLQEDNEVLFLASI